MCSRGQHRAGFGDAVEEYTTPFAGLTPTRFPRLGAGYFKWRDAFGRYEIETLIGTGLSPADLDSQPGV